MQLRPVIAGRLLAVALLLALSPCMSHPALAQNVRGTITDGRGTPLAGVLVELLDAEQRAVARSLSSERGEYRLRAPVAGAYRVRTQRIGFRPTVSGPFALGADTDLVQDLALAGLPITLSTVAVVDRSPCSSLGDSTSATYLVWEQVRTALAATEVSAAGRGTFATTIAYERILDPGSGAIVEQDASVREQYVRQPWRSHSADSLRKTGYIVAERDGSMIYNAPDLGVLLSDGFIEDHCFRLTATRDSARIGISFAPTPARRRIAEITGTLWIDRQSMQLRNMEFGYANAARERIEHAGGSTEFVRLPTGAWVVAGWAIRMPLLERRAPQPRAGDLAPLSTVTMAGIKVRGGRLILVRQGRDTLWSRSPTTVTGLVKDSLSGAPVRAARVAVVGTPAWTVTDIAGRFRIPGVIPGAHTIEVRTPSLDSIGAAHRSGFTVVDSADTIEIRVPASREIASLLCGGAAGQATGMLAGLTEIPGDSLRPRGAKVKVEWIDRGSDARASSDSSARRRSLEVQTDERGMYRICGVPVNTPLTVFAETDARRSRPVVVRIPQGRFLGHVPLTLDLPRDGGAIFSGLVVNDSTGSPILGAEVSLPDLALRVLTDDQGAFRIAGIPAGVHRVVVRRIGYGPLETRIAFAADRTVERRVILSARTTLESVVVNAERGALPDFEENRRIGLGHFLTREDLERQQGRRLSDVLTQVSGVRMVSGVGNRAWVATNRGPRSLQNIPVVDSLDLGRGAQGGTCYALVFMDQTLMYAGKDDEPLFDVNTIAPDQIEAIEYYAGPAQTPLKYSVLGSACGVLVIHTRRDGTDS